MLEAECHQRKYKRVGGWEMFNREKKHEKRATDHARADREEANRHAEEAKLSIPDQLGADGFFRSPSAEHLSAGASESSNVVDDTVGNEVEKDSD